VLSKDILAKPTTLITQINEINKNKKCNL